MALINPKDAETIYNSSEWESRRRQEKEWHAWFTGDKILDDMAELPDDLGEEQPRYPIGVTLVGQCAEVHRDVLFGIPPNTDANPVTILLSSKYKALATTCATYQDVIERIWYDSQGASLLMEAGLLMQAHSGCVFKVAFDKNCTAIPGWASLKITRIRRSGPS